MLRQISDICLSIFCCVISYFPAPPRILEKEGGWHIHDWGLSVAPSPISVYAWGVIHCSDELLSACGFPTKQMGYAVYNHTGSLMSWSSIRPPPLCAAALLPRKTQVTAWESVAPLRALLQEEQLIRGQRLQFFVDNVGAQFALTKGSSTVDDIKGFCAAFWVQVARLDLTVQIFRVSSKANPADAPSRGSCPYGAAKAGEHGTVLASVPPPAFKSGVALRDAVPAELRYESLSA